MENIIKSAYIHEQMNKTHCTKETYLQKLSMLELQAKMHWLEEM